MPGLPTTEPRPAPGPMVPAPFTVRARRQDTADTFTLDLTGPDGAGLPFAPGQFTMLAAGGAGEVPISISGDPADTTRLVHTVRAVGLATRAICAAEPGDVLSVRGPFGRGWPVEALDGADVVVAAGGIGLAPLRPAILALLDRPARHGRLVLLYGGRNPSQLLYPGELEDWEDRGMEVLVTVDSAGPEWLGRVGVVTRLVQRAHLVPHRTAVLLCGPEIMMRFTARAFAGRGVARERIFASMERNMQCGIGRCGHCQLGPLIVCRDGPVVPWSDLVPWIGIREL